MDRIYHTISRTYDDLPTEPPLVVPRPVPGLVSKRVLVMDYLKGVPLSRAREEMIKKGIDPKSPEAKLFNRRLLRALTDVFGRCILETGFFHADPHPGNIFVLDDDSVGLIDFGQVKQISGRNRETLAKVMIALTRVTRAQTICKGLGILRWSLVLKSKRMPKTRLPQQSPFGFLMLLLQDYLVDTILAN